MGDHGSGPTGWLVLGSHDLLTGAGTNRDREAVVLVGLGTDPLGWPVRTRTGVRTVTPPNTAVLRWADLGPVTLLAGTIAGERLAAAGATGADLFSGLLASETLRAHLPGQAAPPVPVFYLSATPAPGGGIDLHVYGQTRFHPEDGCFIRITSQPLRAARAEDLSWLPDAIRLHTAHAPFLNSHDSGYRHGFPGQELEHKYTLAADTDVWTLAADTHRRVAAGALTGFIPKYRDDFQRWDYNNHIFEITAPESERGSATLIPTSDGRHLVKRKWFTTDAFARRETHTFGVTVDGPLEAYVRDVLGLQAHRRRSYRRVRYDINVESVRTGNIFGILYDRVTLLDDPSVELRQCELEYTKSRTVRTPNEQGILAEMNEIATWLDATLIDDLGLAASRGHYSKISFLRDTVRGSRMGQSQCAEPGRHRHDRGPASRLWGAQPVRLGGSTKWNLPMCLSMVLHFSSE